MKRLVFAFAMLLGLALPAAAADPVEGLWKTEPDDGAYAYVRMAPCGQYICGVIERTFNASGEYDSPNKGKVLVINMEPKGNGSYRGKVWRPSNNKIYTGDMRLTGDTLRLRGCVGLCTPLTSKSQTWTRVK
jgi:uncharacterized protein (DUF2147 family)